MGRKSGIDKIDLAQVERLSGLGLTDVEIAHILGISVRTLNNYKKNENFLHALKNGKLKADIQVIDSLFQKAKKGDTTAMIFWLKNRRPQDWREKRDVEINMNGASQVMKELVESLNI